MVFIGVDIDQIDKMAPRGVKSAPGAIELNWHFGAETDLLNLQCGKGKFSLIANKVHKPFKFWSGFESISFLALITSS